MTAPRILVTGSTGFIGRYMMEQLARREDLDVTTLVRPGATVATAQAPAQSRIRPVPADLSNPYAVRLPFQAYDALINLVGPRSSRGSAPWEASVEYTRRLLMLLRRVTVRRIVHFSSVSVYGLPEGSAPVTESFSPAPLDWYGVTKVLGEQMWRDFHRETGIPIVILRPSWVIGHGSHLLDRQLFRAFKSGVKIVMRLGTPFNAVYVRDVADAAVLAALDSKDGLRIYNINAVSRWTFDEFLQAIDQGIPRRKLPVFVPKRFVKLLSKRFGSFKLILSNVFFSADLARDELAFLPRYDLAAMVKEILSLSETAVAQKANPHR